MQFHSRDGSEVLMLAKLSKSTSMHFAAQPAAFKFIEHRSDEVKEAKLLFVEITRAEDYLAITSTGESKFITRIVKSGAALLG